MVKDILKDNEINTQSAVNKCLKWAEVNIINNLLSKFQYRMRWPRKQM